MKTEKFEVPDSYVRLPCPVCRNWVEVWGRHFHPAYQMHCRKTGVAWEHHSDPPAGVFTCDNSLHDIPEHMVEDTTTDLLTKFEKELEEML